MTQPSLPGNPHAPAADALLIESRQAPLIHAEFTASQALVEATLALAHEQRTANLIALWTGARGLPASAAPPWLHEQIIARISA